MYSQILTDNAINYSNSGDIIWSAKNIFGEIKVKVIDNGIGIDLEDQSKILKDFTELIRTGPGKRVVAGLDLQLSNMFYYLTILKLIFRANR